MALEKILDILQQQIGLNPQSIGESSIERAVHHRIGFRNCINTKEYFELLKYDAKEVSALIEEVVVPETWFFRNKGPFQAFTQHVVQEILPKINKRKPVRILSIPCATGEEPYSLAISLREANIDTKSFRIDAVDVSKKSIELARQAHYGKNSFRDVDSALRDKYFIKTEKGWQLEDSIRNLVKFKHGNILSGELSPQPAYYDVIFCRNLLIYFDRKTQQQTLLRLYRALKKGAILFVGHAECAQVSEEYFSIAPYAKSFAFIKRDEPLEKNLKPLKALKFPTATETESKANETQAPENIIVHSRTTQGTGKTFEKTAVLKSLVNNNSTVQKKKHNPKNGLQQPIIESLRPVEKLANEGRYEKAIELCTVYLENHPQSAHGHYLLGMIKSMEGEQKSAESLLKKAIYLDPNHEQALELSCSIAQQKGDLEAVQSFKRRIERVKNRKR
jgi:chemotaxis protein methyltransferase WspC